MTSKKIKARWGRQPTVIEHRPSPSNSECQQRINIYVYLNMPKEELVKMERYVYLERN